MEGQHCTVTSDENGLATLAIHEVKCEDGGYYSAIAANKHGKAMSEAPLIGRLLVLYTYIIYIIKYAGK